MDKHLESHSYPVYNKAMFATFDTLKYYKRLEYAGFTSEQAQAAVDVQKDVLLESFESLTDKLATKEDVRQVRDELYQVKDELKGDIQELKAEIKEDASKLREEFKTENLKLHELFASLKTEMAVMKAMMGVLLGGVVALVLKAFFM
jgi:hypothetical protein